MRENLTIITGKHNVCGIIGDPIEHTLSPLIHNKLAQLMQQQSVYVPFHVVSSQLEEAVRGAHALRVKGLNVTMPHKQEMFQYVTQTDESAKMVGAINTLVFCEEGYKGYNTDYTGLKMSFEENGIEWKNKNVAIIGSGGAAYAAYAAVAKEAGSVHIFNRTVSRAEELKTHMQTYFDTPVFTYGETDACKEEMDLVIQTTGIGMGRYEGQMPVCTEAVLKNTKSAVDLIYHPKETAFLKYAKDRGCLCVNGFGMLFYQAVEAFELMHGVSCEKESIINIKRELLKYAEG